VAGQHNMSRKGFETRHSYITGHTASSSERVIAGLANSLKRTCLVSPRFQTSCLTIPAQSFQRARW
jgi:hypothetical protein